MKLLEWNLLIFYLEKLYLPSVVYNTHNYTQYNTFCHIPPILDTFWVFEHLPYLNSSIDLCLVVRIWYSDLSVILWDLGLGFKFFVCEIFEYEIRNICVWDFVYEIWNMILWIWYLNFECLNSFVWTSQLIFV